MASLAANCALYSFVAVAVAPLLARARFFSMSSLPIDNAADII